MIILCLIITGSGTYSRKYLNLGQLVAVTQVSNTFDHAYQKMIGMAILDIGGK